MKKQKWFCEVCRTRGEIEYEEHAGVLSVVYLLGDAHMKARPNCNNPTTRVRVLNELNATADDWVLFNSMTPVSVV